MADAAGAMKGVSCFPFANSHETGDRLCFRENPVIKAQDEGFSSLHGPYTFVVKTIV